MTANPLTASATRRRSAVGGSGTGWRVCALWSGAPACA
jgi:hypothetical protein